MGSTGDPPVPVGDSPTETEQDSLFPNLQSSTNAARDLPSGHRLDGGTDVPSHPIESAMHGAGDVFSWHCSWAQLMQTGRQPKISVLRTPSETLVTPPVIRMSKPSRISILMTPPGQCTEMVLSTSPSLCATAAAALLLLPLASV